MRDSEFLPAHIQQADMEEAAAAQTQSEIRNAMKRHMERMQKITDWVRPEAIQARKEQHEVEAAAALARAKAMGREVELLPVPDPLPDEMKGQSASTIQAMLRHRR